MQSVVEIWPVYAITKEKMSPKNFTKTVAWKLVPDSFVFAKNEA